MVTHADEDIFDSSKIENNDNNKNHENSGRNRKNNESAAGSFRIFCIFKHIFIILYSSRHVKSALLKGRFFF